MGELPTLPSSKEKVARIGPDAELSQCAAIDYNARVATVFSYTFTLDYLGQLTGLPADDFVLIALSEFLGFRCFLILRSLIHGHAYRLRRR